MFDHVNVASIQLAIQFWVLEKSYRRNSCPFLTFLGWFERDKLYLSDAFLIL